MHIAASLNVEQETSRCGKQHSLACIVSALLSLLHHVSYSQVKLRSLVLVSLLLSLLCFGDQLLSFRKVDLSIVIPIIWLFVVALLLRQ
jgi:hypothetical protein